MDSSISRTDSCEDEKVPNAVKENPNNDSSNAADSKSNALSDIELRRREAGRIRARRNRKRKKEESFNLEMQLQSFKMRNLDLERQIEMMKTQLIAAQEKIRFLESLISPFLTMNQDSNQLMMSNIATAFPVNSNQSNLNSKSPSLPLTPQNSNQPMMKNIATTFQVNPNQLALTQMLSYGNQILSNSKNANELNHLLFQQAINNQLNPILMKEQLGNKSNSLADNKTKRNEH